MMMVVPRVDISFFLSQSTGRETTGLDFKKSAILTFGKDKKSHRRMQSLELNNHYYKKHLQGQVKLHF